ncbi:MAG TPA: sterol desaturase family protein [Thermoanaerobaculia bacterium]|nr:sterol desaturase family protein [Thermoanaerobaculia bacterium]
MTTLIDRMSSSSLNYRAAFVTDASAAAAVGWFGLTRYEGTIGVAAALIVAGFLLWGLLEYVLHRWVLHGGPLVARREHAKHHRDARAMIASPLLFIPIVMALIWTVLALLTSGVVASLLTFGVYAGYYYYAVVHHMQHFHPQLLERSGVFRRQLRRHEMHHRHPDTHFGISNSLWDRVFRSWFLQNDHVVVEHPRR